MHPVPDSPRPPGGAGIGLVEHLPESSPVLVQPAPKTARGRARIFFPGVIDFRIIRVEEKLSVAIHQQVDLHDYDHAWPLRIAVLASWFGALAARGRSILESILSDERHARAGRPGDPVTSSFGN